MGIEPTTFSLGSCFDLRGSAGFRPSCAVGVPNLWIAPHVPLSYLGGPHDAEGLKMAWIIAGSPQEPIEVPEGTPESIPGAPPKIVPEYTAWLSETISKYEALAKSLISHRAEKGRIVEAVVKSALRAILPGRFSIGTGFAITASGKTSSQLDVIIYDAISNAPIILEGGVGLFPIECIYGFVEVKSILDGDALDAATKAIATIRNFAKEKRYVDYESIKDAKGQIVVAEREIAASLPPRSFIFAVNSSFGSISAVELKMREVTTENGAHVHGLAVLEKDWFLSQTPYRRPHEFEARERQALAEFCATVLRSIQSIKVRPASMGRYLGVRT